MNKLEPDLILKKLNRSLVDWPILSRYIDQTEMTKSRRVFPNNFGAFTNFLSEISTPDEIYIDFAWIMAMYCGRLFDDIQDEGLVKMNGSESLAQNVAMGLYTKAMLCLSQLGPEQFKVASNLLNEAFHIGFYCQDLPKYTFDLDLYFRAVFGKTANIAGSQAKAAALIAGAPNEIVLLHRNFGVAFGEYLHLISDLNDMEEDIELGIFTLPVLLAVKDNRALREYLFTSKSSAEKVERLTLSKGFDNVYDEIERSKQRVLKFANRFSHPNSLQIVKATMNGELTYPIDQTFTRPEKSNNSIVSRLFSYFSVSH